MCAWQTALNKLSCSAVGPGENVLVTGASGGVGTALIQLCRVLGAVPHAVASPGKDDALKTLGAQTVVHRGAGAELRQAIHDETGGCVIDAVMDLVGGQMTVPLLQSMCSDMRARTTPPRMSIAGASNGNLTELPWTLIYLNQIRIFGVSHSTRTEAERLIGWIREGRLRPVLVWTVPLSRLREAEAAFVARGSDLWARWSCRTVSGTPIAKQPHYRSTEPNFVKRQRQAAQFCHSWGVRDLAKAHVHAHWLLFRAASRSRANGGAWSHRLTRRNARN